MATSDDIIAFLKQPVCTVAPALTGWNLYRRLDDGTVAGGTIVETEAYGAGDPATHGYGGKTARNAAMFMAAGHVYVYRIYGLHHCLNIVTGEEGICSAVLLRGLVLHGHPPSGMSRRAFDRLAAGPGRLCRTLHVTSALDATRLDPSGSLWLEPPDADFQPDLVQTTRIGISKGTDLPWRWYQRGAAGVSRK